MATAPENAGIMGLTPAGMQQAPSAPPMTSPISYEDSFDATKKGLAIASPQASRMVTKAINDMAAKFDKLPLDALKVLAQILQRMARSPEDYKEGLKKGRELGFFKNLPDEYNLEIISTLAYVATQAVQNREQQGQQPAPQNFARGGIAEAARSMQAAGRGNDSILAHINPQEAALLKALGGGATVNPVTRLPEFGFFDDLFDFVSDTFSSVGKVVFDAVDTVVDAVVDTVKEVAKSPVVRTIATVAATVTMGPAAGAAVSAGLTYAATGDVKSALIAGTTSYFGAPGGVVDQMIPGAITNVAARAAISAGVVGTGAGLLQGKSLGDSIKDGLTAGAVAGVGTGFTKGWDSNIKVDGAGNPVLDSNGQYVIAEGEAKLDQAISTDAAKTKALAEAKADAVLSADQAKMEAISAGAPTDQPLLPTAEVAATADVAGAPAVSATPKVASPVDSISKGGGATATTAAPVVDAGYTKPPGFFTSMKEGVGNLMDAEFDKAMGNFGDAFFPSDPTADQIANAKTTAYDKAYEGAKNLGQTDVAAAAKGKIAADAVTAESMGAPGMIRSYGPAVGAGIAGLGLMGGFSPRPLPEADQRNLDQARELTSQMLKTPQELVAESPSKYIPQGRSGFQYGETGNLLGYDPEAYDRRVAEAKSRIRANMGMGDQDTMSRYGYRTYANTYRPPSNYSPYFRRPEAPTFLAEGGDVSWSQAKQAKFETSPYARIEDRMREMDLGYTDEQIDDLVNSRLSYSQALAKKYGRTNPEYWKGDLPITATAVSDPLDNSGKKAIQFPTGDLSANPYTFEGVDSLRESTNFRRPDPSTNWIPGRGFRYATHTLSPRYEGLGGAYGRQLPLMNQGGLAGLPASPANRTMGSPNMSGIAGLRGGGYPRRNGQISGPGTETSDDVPAMLSDGEFVMTARAVRGMGNGSREKGAQRMYELMDRLERNASKS